MPARYVNGSYFNREEQCDDCREWFGENHITTEDEGRTLLCWKCYDKRLAKAEVQAESMRKP